VGDGHGEGTRHSTSEGVMRPEHGAGH